MRDPPEIKVHVHDKLGESYMYTHRHTDDKQNAIRLAYLICHWLSALEKTENMRLRMYICDKQKQILSKGCCMTLLKFNVKVHVYNRLEKLYKQNKGRQSKCDQRGSPDLSAFVKAVHAYIGKQTKNKVWSETSRLAWIFRMGEAEEKIL